MAVYEVAYFDITNHLWSPPLLTSPSPCPLQGLTPQQLGRQPGAAGRAGCQTFFLGLSDLATNVCIKVLAKHLRCCLRWDVACTGTGHLHRRCNVRLGRSTWQLKGVTEHKVSDIYLYSFYVQQQHKCNKSCSWCSFNNVKIWNLNLFQDTLYILQSVCLMIKIASAVYMLFRYHYSLVMRLFESHYL